MKENIKENEIEEKSRSLINNILKFNSIKDGNYIFGLYIKFNIQNYYRNSNNSKIIPVNLFEYIIYKIIQQKVELNSINNDIIIISNYYLSSSLIRENNKTFKKILLQKKIILFISQNQKTKKWNLFIIFRSVSDNKSYVRIISSNNSYLEDNKMLEEITSKLQKISEYFPVNKNKRLQLNIQCIQINKNYLINTNEFILNFIEYLSDINNIQNDFCNQILALFEKDNTKNFIDLFKVNNHIIDESIKKNKKINKVICNKNIINHQKSNSISINSLDYNLNSTNFSSNINNIEESVFHYQKNNVLHIDKNYNNTTLLDIKVISCKNSDDTDQKYAKKIFQKEIKEKLSLPISNNEIKGNKQRIESIQTKIDTKKNFEIKNNIQIKQIYKELILTKNEIISKLKNENLHKKLGNFYEDQLKYENQFQQIYIKNFIRKSKTFLKEYYINDNKQKIIIRNFSSRKYTYCKYNRKYFIDDIKEDNFFESMGIKKIKAKNSNLRNNKKNVDKSINPIKYSKIEFNELSKIVEKNKSINSNQKKRTIRTNEKCKSESNFKYSDIRKKKTITKTKLHFPPKLDSKIISRDNKNLNGTDIYPKKLDNSFLVFNSSKGNNKSSDSLDDKDKNGCNII